MSDPDPDDLPAPAARPPTRPIEASRRLSQLLERPLGAPAPPGERPEPYMPRPAPAAPPPAPADDTASAAPPRPPAAPAEPELPWFDRPLEPKPAIEPGAGAEPAEPVQPAAPSHPEPAVHDEMRDAAPAPDDDLFDRHEPLPAHTPVDLDEVRRVETSAPPVDLGAPRAPDKVPEWAWPSALDRAGDAAPAERAELRAPEPPAAPEPMRPARREAPAAASSLDPDATRALGNIRRLMLVSNLFMVVAIGAVLTVVGYRLYRSEPAPPPPPPPVATPAPAPAKIPVDMTLTLPRGARIVQTAIAGDRLVLTIEIDGATEIRTFDIKTLEPAGRLSFATVP